MKTRKSHSEPDAYSVRLASVSQPALEFDSVPDESEIRQTRVSELARELCALLSQVPEGARIEALNDVRRQLHAVSPFQAEPVDCVLWVKSEEVRANDYNPNAVAPPEMRLLARSIEQDGFTQPVVGVLDGEQIEIVDGFHRNRVGRENPRVRSRVRGYLPVALLAPGRGEKRDRIASTVRHNRARGVHGVLPMSDIVAALLRDGWDAADIARELGMDADEVLRFKQTVGLPELFKNRPFSRSWE